MRGRVAGNKKRHKYRGRRKWENGCGWKAPTGIYLKRKFLNNHSGDGKSEDGD
jgi:hypothetical protein